MERSRAVRKNEDMIFKEMEKVQNQLNKPQEEKKKKRLEREYDDLMRQLQTVYRRRRDKRRKVTNVNEEAMYNKEANLPRISKEKRQNYSKRPSERSMRKATEQVLRKLHNIHNREKELGKIDYELQKLEQKKKALIKEKENLEKSIVKKKRKMKF